MRAIETGISSQQSYSFTLHSSSSVTVSLTGLTRDFDCRVKHSYCTNNGGSQDDSWSGTLGAGTHTVVGYPYGGGGPGDYTLTVAVNDVSLVSIAQPFGAPDTEDDETCRLDGEEIECPTPDETLDVVGEDPGTPEEPEGTTPPDTDPPSETPDPGDGGGPPGDGPETDPANVAIDACFASSLVSSERVTSNPLEDDRALGSNHGGRNTARPSHSGIDVRASRGDAVMTPVPGTVTETDSGHGTNAWDAEAGTFATTYPPNGNFVRVVDSAGREHVFLHLHTVGVEVGDTVTAFQQIGTANNSGNSRGDHLHYTIWRNSSRQQALDPEGLRAACE